MTDEAAFAVVPEFRGLAISVGRKVPGVADRFQTPADVRRWLERLSRQGGRIVMTINGMPTGADPIADRSRARSRRHRQRPHRRAGRADRPAGVVVLSALRRRSGVLPAGRRRRGEGLLRRRARRTASIKSEYLRNTAIVITVLTDRQGGAVRITDFAPRFRNFGRMFRPPQLIRIIEPVAGLPRITIRMRPTHNYGVPITQRSLGSNHIRYWGGDTMIRLTTDAPLSYIEREAPFVLNRADQSGVRRRRAGSRRARDAPAASSATARATIGWIGCAGCRSSYDWQEPIIRAAISLKLSNFEETGGIIAAHTTSIPEAPGSGRTWDYRFCWLRDAYFVVKALNRIGATQTMEDFISFILGIAATDTATSCGRSTASCRPIRWRSDRAEHLKGYRRRRPGADRQRGRRAGPARHLRQHHPGGDADVLRSSPAAAGRRGAVPPAGDAGRQGDGSSRSSRMPASGNSAAAGSVHTHSAAMCWAGINRLAAIATRLNFTDRAAHWNAAGRSLAGGAAGAGLESEAQGLHRGVRHRRYRCQRPAAARTRADRGRRSALYFDGRGDRARTFAREARYALRELRRFRPAGNGIPDLPILADRCVVVDRPQARRRASCSWTRCSHRNRYGLLSEDIHPQTGALWGNFPQTYSMAGLILTAMRLSRSWEDRYWRG